ncbi:MAG TPA: DUF5946 family protein [Anaerolineales bacterium]|nr:DUF5946 family protein [Anaerolineales bacterium]
MICPACQATLPAGHTCQSVWDELYYAQPLPAPSFDAFCMQHLDSYCFSAKSYAAHLTRLYIGVEYANDPKQLAAVQRWLNGTVSLTKPALLATVGTRTVCDVYLAVAQGQPAMQVAHLWIADVWQAYQPQHALAKEWRTLALNSFTGKSYGLSFWRN